MRTFRVFLSSTFADLESEREAFRERVVPELQQLCRHHGAAFQAVDLRWSISEEAARDRDTMRICLAEIRRCLRLTPRPNFVILLGNRYGWRPLPAEIPASLFERLMSATADVSAFQDWYVRDDNAAPPVYYLKPHGEDDTWRTIEADLLQRLQSAAASIDLSESDRTLFGASATEQEIHHGALSSDSTDRVFCFLREIEGPLPPEAAERYWGAAIQDPQTDAQKRLSRLKARLRASLGDHVFEYKTAWREGALALDHLDAFCADARTSLSRVIERELSSVSYSDKLLREREEHNSFARSRTSVFLGRQTLLEAVHSHTMSSSRSAFAVVGESGSGKSALMAKAALAAGERHSDTVVIYRFAGITPQSSTLEALIRSISEELSRAYQRTDTVPQSRDEVVRDFRARLGYAHRGKPLIVLIDALNQLAEADGSSVLSWIPVELPPYARLFLSSTPDLRESLASMISAGCMLTVPLLDSNECVSIIDGCLQAAGRTLQPQQRFHLLEASRASGLPLYVRLVVGHAARWRSDTVVHELSPDVQTVLNDLFDELSRPTNHGERLVTRTLGLLAAARYGLSEDELLENLSADQEVLDEFRRRSIHLYKSDALPPIIWSRLHADLEPYLTTQGTDGTPLLTFFHAQFRECVVARFLTRESTRLHGHLARYFTAQPLYLDAQRKLPNLRKLSELPFQLVLAELPDQTQAILLDYPFLEAKVHSLGPQSLVVDFDRAIAAEQCPNKATLEQVRNAIRARAHVLRGDPAQFPTQLTARLASSTRPELMEFLADIRRPGARVWLRAITRSLGSSGESLVSVLGGHPAVVSCIAVSSKGRYAASGAHDGCAIWDLEGNVELHRFTSLSYVRSVIFTPDERHIVCATWQGLSLWDVSRGVCLRSYPVDPSSKVELTNALCLTPDGRCALVATGTGDIWAWDWTENKLLLRLRPTVTRKRDPEPPRRQTESPEHSPSITALAVLRDGDRIVIGRLLEWGRGKEIPPALGLWSLRTGKFLSTLITTGAGNLGVRKISLASDGHTVAVVMENGEVHIFDTQTSSCRRTIKNSGFGSVADACISPDIRLIATCGRDRCIHIWETDSQQPIATLKGHHNIVESVVFLPDNRHLLTGSQDYSVRLWDLESARETSADPPHNGMIYALSLSSDGRQLASASADKSVKLWEPHSGLCTNTLTGFTEEVVGVAFTPDGRTLLTHEKGETIRVWDVASGKQRNVLRYEGRDTDYPSVTQIIPSADNRHFFIATDLFDIDTGRFESRLPEPMTVVLGALSDAENIVCTTQENSLAIWNLRTGTKTSTLFGASRVIALPDCDHILTFTDKVSLWEWKTASLVKVIHTQQRGSVHGISARIDLRIVATASGDHDVRLWGLHSGDHLATFTGEAPMCCCVMTHSDPVVIVGDEIGNLHFLAIEMRP